MRKHYNYIDLCNTLCINVLPDANTALSWLKENSPKLAYSRLNGMGQFMSTHICSMKTVACVRADLAVNKWKKLKQTAPRYVVKQTGAVFVAMNPSQ